MRSGSFVLLGLLLGVVACNTAEGVKKDVAIGAEKAGAAIEKGGQAVGGALNKTGEVVGETLRKGGDAVKKVVE